VLIIYIFFGNGMNDWLNRKRRKYFCILFMTAGRTSQDIAMAHNSMRQMTEHWVLWIAHRTVLGGLKHIGAFISLFCGVQLELPIYLRKGSLHDIYKHCGCWSSDWVQYLVWQVWMYVLSVTNVYCIPVYPSLHLLPMWAPLQASWNIPLPSLFHPSVTYSAF